MTYPELQLFRTTADVVWGIVGDPVVELTAAIDVVLLAERPKAVDRGIVCHDAESAEYNRIASDSLNGKPNCWFGPEFLLAYEGRLYSRYLGSPRLRRLAKSYRRCVGKLCTLTESGAVDRWEVAAWRDEATGSILEEWGLMDAWAKPKQFKPFTIRAEPLDDAD